jgi:uncharacterized protein
VTHPIKIRSGDWGLAVVTALVLLLAPNAPIAPLAPNGLVAPVYAQPQPPELTRPVNDFANIIDPTSEAEIERRILELKQASGDVVIVATIDTFAPYADIREYAVKMFENRARGIGEKGKDNGLLILVAVNDRRVQIEVGYDLEQFITDGYAGEVSRTVMAPYFARGEYGPGLVEGATRVIARIATGRGVTLTTVPQVTEPSGIQLSPWLIFAIILFIILMNNAGGRRSRMRRGGTHWGGGNWSGWNSGVGPFGGGGGFGGGGFGGGFGGFGGGRSGGGGGGAGW